MLYLGTIVDENKMIKSHRTFAKVLLNPILNLFGYSLASRFFDDIFLGYEIKHVKASWNIFKAYKERLFYKLEPGHSVIETIELRNS